jgi:hypothetical protein
MLLLRNILPGTALLAGVLDEDDGYGIMDDYVTHGDVEAYEGMHRSVLCCVVLCCAGVASAAVCVGHTPPAWSPTQTICPPARPRPICPPSPVYNHGLATCLPNCLPCLQRRPMPTACRAPGGPRYRRAGWVTAWRHAASILRSR